MLKRFLTTSAAFLVVTACGDTPSQPSLDTDGLNTAFTLLDGISICHLDADLGIYSPIRINGNAETAHRGHGDGQVGDPVPGMEGYEFDESCQPQPITVPISECFARLVENYDAQPGRTPWDWDARGPWEIAYDLPGGVEISGTGTTIAQVFPIGVDRVFCSIGDLETGGAGLNLPVDDFDASRDFLLSLVEPQ
ncbi:MAG TPA: hypothetical protein VK858_04515 [Longimicrobiales bacterium]|nr:hypothetical protein [Longimicrobiales bacterium]